MENNCNNYNKENKCLIVMYIYLDITELILSNQLNELVECRSYKLCT